MADTVRNLQKRWQFSDATAHRMALLAMEQNAHLFADLNMDIKPCRDLQAIQQAQAMGNTPVWLPTQMALADESITQRRDVTSDSLALWLANQLDAEGLLLVKSCPLPRGQVSASRLSGKNITDKAFSAMAASAKFPIWVMQRERYRFSSKDRSGIWSANRTATSFCFFAMLVFFLAILNQTLCFRYNWQL